MFIFLICIFFIGLFSILSFKALHGDFSILSIEEVRSNTYTVSYKTPYGVEAGGDRETKIVQKIIYKSGRIKYKTITYKH